jgi:hypothetical protein
MSHPTTALTTHRRRIAGAAKPGAVFAVLAATLFGGGVFAYRYLADRPGEAAIDRLIPADAQVVATLDLKPSSAEQAALFGRVAAAAEREGLADRFARAFDDGKADPVVRDLLPLADKSYAVALWNVEGSDPDAALIVAVTDAGRAADALARHAARTEQREGLTVYVYEAEGTPVYAALIEGYAVAAPRTVTLLRVRDVAAKKSPALSTIAAYQEARAALPRDANLMAFVSPEAMRAASASGRAALREAGYSSDPTRGAGWLAASATAREGGVSLDWRGPWNADAMPALKRVGSVAAVDSGSFARLPSGALGVMAVSQPAAYAEAARDVANEQPDARKSLESGLRDMERETGISAEADLLPAFGGSTLVAAYPTAGNDGADVLAVVDDARGADPAALADKLRAYLHRENAPVEFQSETAGAAKVWTVTSRDAHHSTYVPKTSGVQKAVNDGRLVYAQVGKAVLIASSRDLLDRAVATYQDGGRGGDGLLTAGSGGGYTGMQNRLVPGAQLAVMVSATRLGNLLRPAMEQNWHDDGSGVRPNDLISLFDGANGGFVMSARYDGRAYTGSVFVPFDFERAVGLAGRAARAAEARKNGQPVEAAPAVETEEQVNDEERG